MERAYQCAELTIPGLLPRQGFSQNTDLPIPYQSAMARNVTAMAAQLGFVNFPLNGQPFFGWEFDNALLLAGEDPSEVNDKLATRERLVTNSLLNTNLRAAAYLAFQHLIVVGDCLFYESPDFEFRVYKLDQYVVRRDPDGRPYEIILKEYVDVDTLKPEVKSKLPAKAKKTGSKDQRYEEMYCWVRRNPTNEQKPWRLDKEIRGVIIPELGGDYENIPYKPLIWTWTGEDYGRSKVEESIGDIRTLESLTRSLIEGAAANAEFRILVDPAGPTELSDISESENGDYRAGREEDVHVLRYGSPEQLSVTMQARDTIRAELDRTFLRDLVMPTNRERVTAYERRQVAQEIEQALGGVASTISRDIVPYVVLQHTMYMQAKGLMEPFKLGDNASVQLRIRAGLEVLSREAELAKLMDVLQMLSAVPPEKQPDLNMNTLWLRIFVARGIETTGLMLTPEEIAAKKQQELAMAAAQQGIQSAGKIAETRAGQV